MKYSTRLSSFDTYANLTYLCLLDSSIMFNWNKSFRGCLVDDYSIKLIETDLSLKQVPTPMRRLVLTVSLPFFSSPDFVSSIFYQIFHLSSPIS